MRFDDHGGDVVSHPGVRLDFSVNLNPFGTPPEVKRAIIDGVDEYASYPDPHCRILRDALSLKHGIPAETIVCGNGAAEIIYRACAAVRAGIDGLIPLLDHEPQTGRALSVLVTAPAFSEYERSARSCGAQIKRHMLDPGNGFAVTGSFLDAITEEIDLVFCCQPNNPTGRLMDATLLANIVGRAREVGALLIVDECFLPFTNAASMIPRAAQEPDLLVVSALTKTHSMAGLRLGYGVTGNPTWAAALRSLGPGWSVSAVAQVAGTTAVGLETWEEDTRRFVTGERARVSARLTDLGLMVCPSDANFLLFQARPDLYSLLLDRGMLIRSCANFIGLDETYFRIGLKTERENDELLDAITEVVRG